MPTPLGWSGRRAPDMQPASRRASDRDAWLVYAACMPYAVPVETVVRTPAVELLPFRMFRRVPMAELRAARRLRS